MIPLSVIREIQIVVSHEGCADGVMSALLCKDALPGARVVFVQYNTPTHRELPAEPGMLFVDMTPPADRADEFMRAGAAVLDHHEGAKGLVDRFGPLGVYSDEPGVSGAVLAYREVWRPAKDSFGADVWRGPAPERMAVLAGVRDTWQRSSPDWNKACVQAAALRFWPWADLVTELESSDWWDGIVEKMKIGSVLLARDAERDRRTVAEAHRFVETESGIRVACFEGLHTSDIADLLADEADLILGWHYRFQKGRAEMVVSCRSRRGMSVLEFAQRNGGGGHRHAAGFSIPVDLNEPNPYVRIETLVNRHWGRGDDE